MPLEAGSAFTRVGAKFDDTGFQRWERRMLQARREGRTPVETPLRGDYDDRGFKDYERGADRVERRNRDMIQSQGRLRTSFGSIYGRGGAAFAAAGGLYGLVTAGKAAIDMAGDIEESLSKNRVLFGDYASKVEALADRSAKAFGISRRETLEYAGTFGGLFESMDIADRKAADMSTSLITLAADMASFNNANPTEVLEALRSGLTGEAEPLRRFGILLNEARVGAEGVRLGLAKTEDQLTEGEKAQARYSLILKDTKSAQGDFARTAEGSANQTRILRARVGDLQAELGEKLLPAFRDTLHYLNDFMDEMERGEGAGGTFVDALRLVGREITRFGDWFQESVRTVRQWTDDLLGVFTTLLRGAQGVMGAIGGILPGGAGRRYREAARDIDRFADSLDRTRKNLRMKNEADKVGDDIDRMRRRTKAALGDVRKDTETNMRTIRRRLGSDSEAGAKALTKNYEAAVSNIRSQMRRGRISTANGLEAIRDLMADAFKELGMSPAQARRLATNRTTKGREDVNQFGGNERAGGKAIGGIANPGSGGADDHLLLDPSGRPVAMMSGTEGILNRPQMEVTDFALAVTSAMGLQPYGGLGALWGSGMRHYAAGGLLPRRAAGGIVPVPGSPGERANAAILDEIAWVKREFPGLVLTDAFGPGHSSPGHTVTGTAADFSGPDRQMDAATAALVRAGYLVGYDGRFGSQNWPGHGPSTRTSNFHLHVEFGGKRGKGLKGAVGAAIKKIRAPQTDLQGSLGAYVQGGLNLVTDAANAKLEDAAASSLTAPMPGGSAARGAVSEAQARRWIAAGLRYAGQRVTPGAINTLLFQAKTESGWDPRAQNNWDVNAKKGTPSKGFLQTIGPTFDAHKVRPGDNIWNPVHNIAAAVRYMLSRYGRLIGTGKGYNLGGLLNLPRYANGKPGGSRRPPIRYGLGNLGGTAPAGGGGNPGGGKGGGLGTKQLRTMRAMQTDRIEDFEAELAEIPNAQRHYAQVERRYNLSEEEFIRDDGSLNTEAIAKRVGELVSLRGLALRIQKRLGKARAIARRVVATYKTIVNRLRRSLRHASKKDRSGIEGRIKTYRTRLGEWQDKLTEVGFDYEDARLDVEELRKEAREVQGTRAQAPDPPDTGFGDTDTGGGDLGTDAAQATPSPLEIATQAAEMLRQFNEQRVALYGQSGSNYVAAAMGGLMFSDASQRAAGMRHFGAFGGGDAGGLTIINNFTGGPSEPYTWLDQQRHTLESRVG